MKKLLLYISFLFIANITFAQVKVGANGNIIATGIYPVANSSDVKGGVHYFQTLSQRNALPTNFRDTGMLAYVGDSAKFFYLNNGIANSNWTVWSGSGGSGGSGIDSIPLRVSGDTTFQEYYIHGVLIASRYWQGDGTGGGGSSSTDNWDSVLTRQTTPMSQSHSIDFGGNSLTFDRASGYSFFARDTTTGGFTRHYQDPYNFNLGVHYPVLGDAEYGASIIGNDSTLVVESHSALNNNGFDTVYAEKSFLQINPNIFYFYSLDHSDDTISSHFRINLDSSNANPNNIAWFDTHNILHRGYLPTSGGSTPSLQAVTDVGYITTNPLVSRTSIAYYDSANNRSMNLSNARGGSLTLQYNLDNTATNGVNILADSVTGIHILYFPSNDGTLIATVNGQHPTRDGNINTRLKSYTVATLPASPTQGDEAAVTDATSPTYLGVLTGGGSTYTPCVFNGTIWISH